jgi:GNAT superfamily N-acetyltransferase
MPIMLTSPTDLWACGKQIDGLGGEWSYDIFIYRALNFHQQSSLVFYEPIGDYERLALETLASSRALAAGVPLGEEGGQCVAMRIFPSFFDSQEGEVSLPSEGEDPIGCHSVEIVGLQDERTLVFRHDWSGWANGDGIGFVSRQYVEEYATAIWTSKLWNRGPLESTAQRLLQGPEDVQLVRLWRQWRPHGSEDADQLGVRLHWYRTWSLASECPAEALSITIKAGHAHLRIGTAVLLHDHGVESRDSMIVDLFVWPPYRGRGYGRALESFAARRAEAAGSTNMTACVWDADVVLSERMSVGFLEALGYKIQTFTGRQLFAEGRRPL